MIAAYRERLTPGSFIAVSHIASEQAGPELRAQVTRLVDACAAADEHVYIRSHREILDWFEGMRLVEPGLVCLPDWRPDNLLEQEAVARALGYGGVARV
ncbi:SAM-dependent methyltransferase [Lentzea sp. DG1S-22]|uniref:SAM-dependent methyltransferase n=1 Tax=Lentzea sp. DG1S-22 TaxID=3108822 RepID=UPI002E79DEBF|nr:SAM-dependent methyltransferase [Lentzea sp. DG1S-22]WVH84809.1 SAM-dependent methyltransferase [Lentzea sp. DG1S-22]